MNYSIKIIEPLDFKTSNWSGGTTTELCIFPPNSSYKKRDFKWRISSATVELEHSIFTNLPNFYRYITITEGILRLRHNNGQLLSLSPFEVHGFEGDWETESFGKIQDFNLMINKGCTGRLFSFIIDSNSDFLQLNLAPHNSSYDIATIALYSHYEDMEVRIDGTNILELRSKNLLLINRHHVYVPKIEVRSLSSCTLIASHIYTFLDER